MQITFVVIFIGTLFCLTSCTDNQDTSEDTDQTAHEDTESKNQESTSDTAKLPAFTVEDSSWKIVWHGSSDDDLLVSVLSNFFLLVKVGIIVISVLSLHQKILIKMLEDACPTHKLVLQKCCSKTYSKTEYFTLLNVRTMQYLHYNIWSLDLVRKC